MDEQLKQIYYNYPKDVGRKWIYNQMTGKELNLDNPKTLEDKVNWLMVNLHGKTEGNLTDKYLVKDYIKNKNIKNLHIAKTYKKYDDVEDINLDELPEKFVLKCNNGSGKVFICTNKKDFDLENAKKQLAINMEENFAYFNFEYHYQYIKPCIIAEEYLDDGKNETPNDYKFYVMNGKVENILVCTNRYKKLTYDNYDLDWNYNDYSLKKWKSKSANKKPKNLKQMIKVAEKLGEDFVFVRVDLYNIKNKIYFGELTFTPFRGVFDIYNEKANIELGEKLDLSKFI